MDEYQARIEWLRNGAEFTDNRYSRGHVLRFDGGLCVPGSSSPSVVPVPMSVEAAVDPEEAFVASLSSCHMLWFLSIAAKRGLVVESYMDDARGLLGKDERGKRSMTLVTLQPQVRFADEKRPQAHDVSSMHDEAHEECFIANSVRTEVRCEPRA